jgi:hypothetical protein
MKTVLYVDPESVSARLQKLGLTEPVLLRAVNAGYIAKANCTENHPPLFPHIAAWSETVRTLRDVLKPQGWTRFNDQNSPKTLSPDGTVSIMVSAGNDATGNPSTEPATKSPKGPTTADAIEVNRSIQLYLPGMEAYAPPIDEDERISTWVLLAHHAKNELRAELSLPLAVSTDGRVSVWQERIILTAQPLDGEPAVISPPALPETYVAVRRRA